MNTAWLNERVVVILICVAQMIQKQGSSQELDQVLFDSLRIYSSTFQEPPGGNLAAMLVSMDRPAKEENLGQVKKAMQLIKAHPENIVSILENFSALES